MPNHAERTHTRRRRPRVGTGALTAVLSLLLAGCAATSETPGPSEEPSGVLQQIGARLPGNYISIRREDRPSQSLLVERRASSEPGSLALSMIQTDADGGNVRRYGLILEPGAIENRLEGRFALLGENGQTRRSCSMAFHLTGKGLVGETDPASCRFGEGPEMVGLLKEIAFDGRRISIGDRLVDPQSGELRGDDRVIHFLPAPAFSGWLGVREGEEWRVARDFSLKMGERIEPIDAAEMSLGVAVELDYYRMERGDADTLMRLTVTEPSTGKVIAESWSEPGSGTIGLALPDLQVGLTMSNRASSGP